ncbi:MAG: HAD-IC family P-type ATPase, partial [Geminicoccaceae bacterium]
ERFAKVDVLVIDKTGTLTEGKPTLTDCRPAEGLNEDRLLQLAASLEQASEHPLAEAVLEAAEARGLSLLAADDFEAAPGKGIRGQIEHSMIALGNRALMADISIDIAHIENDATALEQAGKTAMFVAIDGKFAGLIAIADRLKETTKDAIHALHESGLRLVMATGDNPHTAEAIGRDVGLDEIHAELRPEDKAALVNQLRAKGHRVAMAGDGINDAPALAAADVGIAMGNGTDIAIESAGITLATGNLAGVVKARRLALSTMRNIRQNLVFAFAYNAAGVPIAAGVLYPIIGVLLSPMIAALAMSLSSVSVIGNALRLRGQPL